MNIKKITPNKCPECENSNIYMIIYGLINHNILKRYLKKCKFILDNNGIWKNYNLNNSKLIYCMAGDKNWLQF